MPLPKIIFIVGPTACGKTEIGLHLAQLTPCEFISADSMQIYKGLDIITAKLPAPIRRKYPHHLIDVISSRQTFSVADFCAQAARAVREIVKKRKLPVVIGGTGLYINSLLYGIFQGPAADEKLRARLEQEAGEKGNLHLHERLKQIDPYAASRIKPGDLKRMIRALEVYEMTQKPISVLQGERQGLANEYKVYVFGLRRDRQDLYRRIDQRVDFMVNEGLLDEVRNLMRQKLSQTASQCIGVKEIEGFFRKQHDLAESVRLMKRNSRHFAKRQLTWFAKNKDIEWIDLKEDENTLLVARRIFHQISKGE
ncbi:MAG: tRNA (adenosine(37)-N6)-dimethylallyltransferase MiaA [Candidatus Omnitrophota bacterium]